MQQKLYHFKENAKRSTMDYIASSYYIRNKNYGHSKCWTFMPGCTIVDIDHRSKQDLLILIITAQANAISFFRDGHNGSCPITVVDPFHHTSPFKRVQLFFHSRFHPKWHISGSMITRLGCCVYSQSCLEWFNSGLLLSLVGHCLQLPIREPKGF